MATCWSVNYHVYVFALVEGSEGSAKTSISEGNSKTSITLQMLRKQGERRVQKVLQPVYLKTTSMKVYFNDYGELRLLMGTNCGRLLTYSNF